MRGKINIAYQVSSIIESRLPVIRFLLLLTGLITSSLLNYSQEPEKKRIYSIDGYLKYMLTTDFSQSLDDVTTDNLIHNRINVRVYPHKTVTLALDVRSRIHFGQLVKLTNSLTPLTNMTFGELIDANNDIFDMSVLIVNRQSFVFHTMIDRAYINWTRNKFEMTVGRQRINWGVALVWNPNDIFNAYSFYDFDYEERSGSDAVRLTYYTGFASSIQIAAKTATKIEDLVAAAMYKFNKANYDFQVLAGVANEDITLGGGWAGNVKNAGFKGEFSYFHPYNHFKDSIGVFSGTIAFDYSFRNSLYFNASYLFTSNGSNDSIFSIQFNETLSAKNLSPFKHSFFTQWMYPVTPLFNVGGAIIYSPSNHSLFINPVLTYSIKENWDIDLVGQLFFAQDAEDNYTDLLEVVYLRLKWSY